LGCLRVLIAYIGHGRPAHLPAKFCTKGHHEYCSVVIEDVDGHELWIWHAESHNDINELQCSPVFVRLAKGHAQDCNYKMNDHPDTSQTYL
jgi:hypothetical protein